MIGQQAIIDKLKEQTTNSKFPRFSIIVGNKGAGRKTLAKFISKQLNCKLILIDNKIDDLRELIQLAYQQTETLLYCITEYENMSYGAVASILKLVEEPPQNSYIILTACNKSNLLATILSRGAVYELQEYTEDELTEFAEKNSVPAIWTRTCENPGQLLQVKDYKYADFNKFILNMIDNISKASIGNALKLATYFKTKDEEEENKYDFRIIVNAVNKELLLRVKENTIKNVHNFVEILKMSMILKNKWNNKFSKVAIVDDYLIQLRGLLRGVN